MRRHSGFSLIELMVAMALTLVVSGAIYGLMTTGGNAFRREPEVSDRQQNIRLAMDLVSRDVFNGGASLPTFAQVFTRVENYVLNPGPCTGATGVDGCGIPGTMGAAAAAARAAGDGGDPSENTDVLEIVSTEEECPNLNVCDSGGIGPGLAGPFTTRERLPACLTLPGLVLLSDNNLFTVQRATLAGGTASACPQTGGSTVNNRNLTLTAALSPWSPAGTMLKPEGTSSPITFLYKAHVTRYVVAPANDPIDLTLPALWRSESGRYASDGTLAPLPGAPGFPGANSPWELVARGIEDLQLEYMGGDGVWRNLPPVSTVNDWDSLVRQVRITLSARSSAANLQGQSAGGGTAAPALRGQLATTVSPRAAFNELQICKSATTPLTPCPDAKHVQ